MDIALELESLPTPKLKDISSLTKKISSKYRLSSMPGNEDILRHTRQTSEVRKLLKVKPVKTASGVAIIAVMPKPFVCPHGRCIYCPGGIQYNTPPSYIGSEPVTKTAQKFDYDPYNQV